jgi:hypothetical protein
LGLSRTFGGGFGISHGKGERAGASRMLLGLSTARRRD